MHIFERSYSLSTKSTQSDFFLCPFTFNCNFNYSCRLPYPSNSVQLLPHLLKVYEEDPRTAAGQLSLSHSCPPENTGEI